MPQHQTSHKRAFSACGKEILLSGRRSGQPNNRKTRRFILKLLIVTGAPIALFAGIELILRASGYGVSTSFFEKTSDGKYLIPNPNFSRRFFPPNVVKEAWPFKIPVNKEDGVKRIFVVGDSAAQGTPAPAFGFARILEKMLEEKFPDKRFEVVNVAMRGINSHVMVPIVQECAKFGADAFLVYAGNNEIVGLYAPSPKGFNLVDYPFLIKLKHLAARTKFYQMMNDLLVKIGKTQKKEVQDFEYFQEHRIHFTHKSRQWVVKNFESNLEKICKYGTSRGAKVFLSTVAVNLQDCPPFGSLHRNDLSADEKNRWECLVKQGDDCRMRGEIREALKHYSEAANIDPQYAELQYKIGMCYMQIGETQLAIEHYKLARDFDALPFRAEGRLNEAIARVASRFATKNVVLVDSENAFLSFALSRGQAPGKSLFHEHVHLKFSGDYLLAKTFYEKLVAILFPEMSATNSAIYNLPSEQECALMLAYTPWDELDIAAAILKLTASPLFQGQLDHQTRQAEAERVLNEKLKKVTLADLKKCAAIYEQAIAKKPNDWQLRFNYGNILQLMGNHELACKEYQIALNHVPFFRQCQQLYNTSLTYLKYQQSAAQMKRY